MRTSSGKRHIVIALLLVFSSGIMPVKGQNWAVKSNLLYDATTTPNIGVEYRLSDKWTTGINAALNPWSFSNNKKLKHFLVSPQGRYWFCESFEGHFVGMNAAYAHYNSFPLDFTEMSTTSADKATSLPSVRPTATPGFSLPTGALRQRQDSTLAMRGLTATTLRNAVPTAVPTTSFSFCPSWR